MLYDSIVISCRKYQGVSPVRFTIVVLFLALSSICMGNTKVDYTSTPCPDPEEISFNKNENGTSYYEEKINNISKKWILAGTENDNSEYWKKIILNTPSNNNAHLKEIDTIVNIVNGKTGEEIDGCGLCKNYNKFSVEFKEYLENSSYHICHYIIKNESLSSIFLFIMLQREKKAYNTQFSIYYEK